MEMVTSLIILDSVLMFTMVLWSLQTSFREQLQKLVQGPKKTQTSNSNEILPSVSTLFKYIKYNGRIATQLATS
jgi:hypothetical protein